MPVLSVRNVSHAVRRLGHDLVEMLLPGACCLCRGDMVDYRRPKVVCEACERSLTAARKCLRCAASLPDGKAPPPEQCQWCRHLKLPFASITAVGNYEAELGDAVLRGKTNRGADAAWDMGQLLADQVTLESLVDPLVVDVPMHWSRRLRRGMSSAAMIARSLATRRNWQQASVAQCARPIAKQSELPFSSRQKNVRGAFQITGTNFSNRPILLVDDIMTTGSTLRELARTLRAAGGDEIHVAVVARATGSYADV